MNIEEKSSPGGQSLRAMGATLAAAPALTHGSATPDHGAGCRGAGGNVGP